MVEAAADFGPILILRLDDGALRLLQANGVTDNAAVFNALLPLIQGMTTADELGEKLIGQQPDQPTVEETGERERLERRLAELVMEEAEQARRAVCEAACDRLNALLKRGEK